MELEFPFRAKVKQFAAFDDCVYVITESGLLYKADMRKKIPIITDVNLTENSQKHISKNNFTQTKIFVDNLYHSNNQLLISTK